MHFDRDFRCKRRDCHIKLRHKHLRLLRLFSIAVGRRNPDTANHITHDCPPSIGHTTSRLEPEFARHPIEAVLAGSISATTSGSLSVCNACSRTGLAASVA
jgi:hypothetical protein